MGRFEGGPFVCPVVAGGFVIKDDEDVALETMLSFAFCRPGSDLLSRDLSQSTIGAGAFHGRVRNGNGCSHPARTTRSAKRKAQQARSWGGLRLQLFDIGCLFFFALACVGLPIQAGRPSATFGRPVRSATSASGQKTDLVAKGDKMIIDQ